MTQFVRAGIHSLSEVLPYICSDLGKKSKDKLSDPRAYRNYSDRKVWMARKRYKVFLESTDCCICGLEGQFFALEQQKDQKGRKVWFFNLYGRCKDGKEILFTQDHAIPKSRGGSNELDNLQTMCSPCNNSKGNSLPTGNEKNGKHKNGFLFKKRS